MKNTLEICLEFCDNFLSDMCLDDQIRNTNSLKSLYVLLSLKRRRVINNQCNKTAFSVYKICEQESDNNLSLQCEVLKLALSVTKNEDDGVSNVIQYLSDLIKNCSKPPIPVCLKIIHFLKEICVVENKLHFYNRKNTDFNMFLLYNLAHGTSVIKTYILSHILNNYVIVLNTEDQISFIDDIFLYCKLNKNIGILCTIYADINFNLMEQSRRYVLCKNEFWEFLGNSLSDFDSHLQNQATFLLKALISNYYGKIPEESSCFNCVSSFIQTGSNILNEESKKIWENFFVLLETAKEKQVHLVQPSLKLLNSMKYLNHIWQKCIYEVLLHHSQNYIISCVIQYILTQNVIIPDLFHSLLAAINKSDCFYTDFNSIVIISSYCNNLEETHFSALLNAMLNITWSPASMWYFFNYLFCSKLKHKISLIYFKLIYDLIIKIPHVYIRKGCAKLFMTSFLNNYDWNDSTDSVFKMLVMLKDYNHEVFVNTVLNHIDTNFIKKLSETGLILDKDNLGFIEVFMELINILKAQEVGSSFIQNLDNPNEELLVAIYANDLSCFSKSDIESIMEKVDNLTPNGINNLLIIIDNLMKDTNFERYMYVKVIEILSEPRKCSSNMIHIALYVAVHYYSSCDSIRDLVRVNNEFFISRKFENYIFVLFCELYLKATNCDISVLEYTFNNENNIVITKVFEKVVTILEPNSSANINILQVGFNILPNLTRSKYFNSFVKNYIKCLFLANWSDVTVNQKVQCLIENCLNMLLKYTDLYPSVNYYLAINIRNFANHLSSYNSYFNLITGITVELLLKGILVKKEERIEYNVCQDIYNKLGKGEDNPNLKRIIARLSCLEAMLLMTNRQSQLADYFAHHLIEKYRMHFNKRYFPDSQIHLQKLRVIQALLIIHPFISHQRKPLIDLIMESFCMEIHQPCVKQLMQWLLFCLLKDTDNSVSQLIDQIENTTKTQPSTVAAFILVLLYVVFTKPETVWCTAVEALLPWCMGPHFKLRIYSQMAIRILYKEAVSRCYENFCKKYGFLEKSVNFIIEASGHALQETLKADEVIFNSFNPERDYSFQTILVDIPKLNNVTSSEWQNFFYYKFSNDFHIPLKNADETFVESIKNIPDVNKVKEGNNSENISESNFNIQRKMTPWKTFLEEADTKKEVGDFILIASLIDKPTNLGGLARTCEVFGVKQLILNDSRVVNDKSFKGLSMTSENWVECLEVKVPALRDLICELRDKGYCIVGAEQTSESVKLNKYNFNKKTALLLGNEKEGIPPNLIPILDACVEIPQLGLVRSLNVHVAGATFIWEYAKQHLI